ncbi:MAG: polymerase, sigma-24 subunit, subfamily [Chitinophagaceae bacterium]|nr:polymerase, sigma-24 subunit, subfamily [Chitinophagaceae bacterium]
MHNYGRKFTDNTALIEDAIQTVFITLWNNRENLATIHSPRSYLFYSFRNYIFKEKKKLQKTFFQPEELEFGIDNFIVDKETHAVLSHRLKIALTSLTSRQREAVYLRFYEALSYEETAEVMKSTVKSTYKLVARSLLKLKEVFPKKNSR